MPIPDFPPWLPAALVFAAVLIGALLLVLQ